MLTISAPCPRCLEPRTTFTMVTSDPADNGHPGPRSRETVFRCGHCLRLVIVEIYTAGNRNIGPSQGHVGDISKHRELAVLAIHPSMPTNEAPEHVPEPVAKAYVEGLEILELKMWTPAAGSFRTAIDRATKLLWGKVAGGEKVPKDLFPRIQALKERLAFPQSITDWAHTVRIVGNEMHDIDDISESDARDAGRFAELFLTYAFTLPKRLEDFRQRRDQSGSGVE